MAWRTPWQWFAAWLFEAYLSASLAGYLPSSVGVLIPFTGPPWEDLTKGTRQEPSETRRAFLCGESDRTRRRPPRGSYHRPPRTRRGGRGSERPWAGEGKLLPLASLARYRASRGRRSPLPRCSRPSDRRH